MRMHSVWVSRQKPLRNVYRNATALPSRHTLSVIRLYALVSRPFAKYKASHVKSIYSPGNLSPQYDRCYVTTAENKVEHTSAVVQKPSQKVLASVNELVPIIVPALFIDAIKNGTTNWDLVIARSLMIVLYNVLHPRRQSIPEEFPPSILNLRFQDVALRVIQVDGVRRLFAKINYNYKGSVESLVAYLNKRCT